MENIIQKAIIKAMELHQGQMRKGNENIPYIVHPIEVAIQTARFSVNDKFIAAAILHDVVEDCDYNLEQLELEFGPTVWRFVRALTENKQIEDWESRKMDNLRVLSNDTTAAVLKAFDAYVNMNDTARLVSEIGPLAWRCFKGTKEQKLSYYRQILSIARDYLPQEFLADYVGSLKDLEYADMVYAPKMLADKSA